MIYKFTIEVCNDDNQVLYARSEESGNFWRAYLEFMDKVTKYAKSRGLGQKG